MAITVHTYIHTYTRTINRFRKHGVYGRPSDGLNSGEFPRRLDVISLRKVVDAHYGHHSQEKQRRHDGNVQHGAQNPRHGGQVPAHRLDISSNYQLNRHSSIHI